MNCRWPDADTRFHREINPAATTANGFPQVNLNTLTWEPRRSLRSCSSSRFVRVESSRLFAGTSSFGRQTGVSSLCGSPRRRSWRRRSSVSGSLFILLDVNRAYHSHSSHASRFRDRWCARLQGQVATRITLSWADRLTRAVWSRSVDRLVGRPTGPRSAVPSQGAALLG